MSIARCDSGTCTTPAIDSYGSLYWPPDKTFAVWSVAVSGQDVAVILNGAVVMTASLPDVANTGPGVAGVYSNDNDGGIWWDEFCVWKSE